MLTQSEVDAALADLQRLPRKRESTTLLLSYIESDVFALRLRIETGKGDVGNLTVASRIAVYAAELAERGY